MHPLTDIHLRSHVNFEIADNGDIRYLWQFVFAAGLIMLTACINYMNLATARAGLRSREVAIRKVSGADRGQLARQFLGESVFTALLACVIAVAASWLLLPAFNLLVDREIPSHLLTSVWFIALVPAAGVMIGVVSGSYPAAILSRLAPVAVLESGAAMRTSRSGLRNLLVVVQFTIGIVLVLNTITGLALLIACLGLFGLAAFLTLQRTKEIGVRKALGAGIGDILVLLSKDFGRLILVSFFVGAPVAWFAATRWLDAYAFHIEVGRLIFIYAGLFIAGVTMLTVGVQSVKAARVSSTSPGS